MSRHKVGKFILTFVVGAGAVIAIAVDWNPTHLFNPRWHPHARFDDAMYLFFLDGMSLIVLWLLWRRAAEPGLGVTVVVLFAAAVWTPFFYIEALIPSTSPLAADDFPVVRVGGMRFAPNVIIAAVFFLLALIGYWLARDAGRGGQTPRSVGTLNFNEWICRRCGQVQESEIQRKPLEMRWRRSVTRRPPALLSSLYFS